MEKILDDDFHIQRFTKPTVCRNNETAWLLLYKQLERRSLFFLGIIFIATIYIFTSYPIVLIFGILLNIFSIQKVIRKFSRLKKVTSHYFIINQDTLEYHSSSFLRTYNWKDLKDKDELEWGLELDFYNKRKEHSRLIIPKTLENYDNLAGFLKQLNSN